MSKELVWTDIFPQTDVKFDRALPRGRRLRILTQGPGGFKSDIGYSDPSLQFYSNRDGLLNNDFCLNTPLTPLEHPINYRREPSGCRYFWRTFTETALHHFIEANGQGNQISSIADQLRQSEKAHLSYPRDELNRPGHLWTTFDPGLALSVGFARGLIENEKVSLVGFPIYTKEFMDPSEVLHVLGLNRSEFSVNLPHAENYGKAGFMEYIVRAISSEQWQAGVMYSLRLEFFQELWEVLSQLSRTERQPIMNEVSLVINDWLDFLATVNESILRRKNDSIPEHDKNKLPDIWSLFLDQVAMPRLQG